MSSRQERFAAYLEAHELTKGCSPRGGEDQKDFMGRCVPKMIGKGKDQEQAVAICMSEWRGKEEFGPDPVESIPAFELNSRKAETPFNPELRDRDELGRFASRDQMIGTEQKSSGKTLVSSRTGQVEKVFVGPFFGED